MATFDDRFARARRVLRKAWIPAQHAGSTDPEVWAEAVHAQALRNSTPEHLQVPLAYARDWALCAAQEVQEGLSPGEAVLRASRRVSAFLRALEGHYVVRPLDTLGPYDTPEQAAAAQRAAGGGHIVKRTTLEEVVHAL